MKGIDIYEGNRVTNYDELANNIDFAILRVGYGVSYLPEVQKDIRFEQNYRGLHNKVPLGAYYYAYANEIGEGKKEAENCLKYLGNKKLELPIYYDLEDKTMNYIPKVAREFVDTIKAAGYKAGIYCNLNWAKNKINLDDFKDCSIWIAAYGNNNGQVPQDKPTIRYDIWQYTSKGQINGVYGNVDMDIADNLPGIKPEPQPEPTYTHTQFVKDIQIAEGQTGKWIDGIAGVRTLNLTPTISRYKNNTNPCVKPVQKYLYSIGYVEVGKADGIAGAKFEKAVKNYQRNNNLPVIDGELTARANTWRKLLRV